MFFFELVLVCACDASAVGLDALEEVVELSFFAVGEAGEDSLLCEVDPVTELFNG
jgi:hypothetical protein